MPDDLAGKACTPQQRRSAINDIVIEEGSTTAQELASRFGVSVMTVHRDLDELERQGVVRKFRGGVTAQPSGVFESKIGFRNRMMRAQKRAIAAHAAQYVEPGMSILLDDSTTVERMIPHLARLTPLRVATNYLAALQQLSEMPGIGLMALGGDYDPLYGSFVGNGYIEAIESIRVDAAFMSTSALSGHYTFHQEERFVAIKRKTVQIAAKRYLLMDHTKLGKVALRRLLPLSEFDLVIVDSETPDSALAELEQNNVRYKVAS